MRDLALSWYSLLNTLFATLEGPVRAATFGAGGSLLTAVLLGLLGAASPCQLSTNASSIAYLVGGIGPRGRSVGWSAAAYVAGKVLVYSAIGVLALLIGRGLQGVAIPTVIVTRKVLGPLMILIGLALIETWRPRLALGHRWSAQLRQYVTGGGAVGAFLLGVAFSFAFCPTLALLFFGFVIPMAAVSAAGPLYPMAFALGTTLPLIFTAGLMVAGAGTPHLTNRLAVWEPRLRRVAGVIFLFVGLNDTLLYWFL